MAYLLCVLSAVQLPHFSQNVDKCDQHRNCFCCLQASTTTCQTPAMQPLQQRPQAPWQQLGRAKSQALLGFSHGLGSVGFCRMCACWVEGLARSRGVTAAAAVGCIELTGRQGLTRGVCGVGFYRVFVGVQERIRFFREIPSAGLRITAVLFCSSHGARFRSCSACRKLETLFAPWICT